MGGPGGSCRVPGPRPCRRPVSRILSWTIIPLGAASPRRSSNLPAGFGLRLCPRRALSNLSTLAHRADTLVPLECADAIPAYLVLLRVGFTMRRPLLAARCALTAPFHPYLPSLARRLGGMLSVALAVQPPLSGRPGRYPAHCPAESGLSSPSLGLDLDSRLSRERQRSSSRLQFQVYRGTVLDCLYRLRRKCTVTVVDTSTG